MAHGEGMVQTTHLSRNGQGGESRSGKHNPLVLGSNPSGPTIQKLRDFLGDDGEVNFGHHNKPLYLKAPCNLYFGQREEVAMASKERLSQKGLLKNHRVLPIARHSDHRRGLVVLWILA